LNGVKITFKDIQPNMIKIEAILLHLAKTCRYHGLLEGWYSNAEHSYLAAFFAGNDLTLKRECLIHDFGEHITADVAGPVKKACPDYDFFCNGVQEVMNLHFLGHYRLQPRVKHIDLRLTATEQLLLRNSPPEDFDAEPYPYLEFHQWEWREAYTHLKGLFYQLFPEYKDSV